MGKKAFLSLVVLASVVFIAIVSLTTPTTAGPLGVLALFVCLYITVLAFIILLIYSGSRAVVKTSAYLRPDQKVISALNFRKSYYYSSVISLGLVMLLGMQSVKGIGLYEFILVCFFILVGCLYVSRRMV